MTRVSATCVLGTSYLAGHLESLEDVDRFEDVSVLFQRLLEGDTGAFFCGQPGLCMQGYRYPT
jgi:hypothetical protein